MKKIYGYAAAAALTVLLAAAPEAFAATPGRVSYQGTLRKDGRLFNGTVSMEFRLVSADTLTEYWNSGSTSVVVSTGLFRYQLGVDNPGPFSTIAWKDISPYVQMRVDSIWLPAEPLYSSVYSLHAATAESSTGTFTINGGDLRILGPVGVKGVVFPDSTIQYAAAGWAVEPGLTYTSFLGGAGVGILSPQTRLDVQGKVGDAYAQFWRDSSGVVRATMTATGSLIADGSLLRNLPAGADNMGNHVATTTLQMSGFSMVNAGSVTAAGPFTTYSSATVGGALGLGAGRIQLKSGVAIASATAADYGGVYFSSHVFLPSGARYYGDGSYLTGVVGNIVDSLSATLGAGSNAGGAGMVNLGNVAMGIGSAGTRLDVQAGAGGYSQFWRDSGGTIVASMSATGVLYASGAGIRGLPAADNLGTHAMSQNLRAGAYWLSSDGGNAGLSVNAAGNVGVGINPPTARLEVNDADANTNTSGVKFTNFACAGFDKLSVDVSGNLVCVADQTGSGTGNLVDSLSSTLGAGTNAGALGMVNLGDVAIGLGAAGTRLDVQPSGAYSQFWRDAGGTIVASMSASGVLYGDASGLRGVPAADNLGNHAATQNLRLGSYYLSNDGSSAGVSVNPAGDVGIGINPATAKLELNDGDANAVTSGMKFTDFSCSGTQKLTVDVSGNLVCSADQTGSGSGNIVDSLSETLGAGNNAGSAGMVNLGNVAIGLGAAGTRLDVQTGAGGYSQFWRNFAGTVVASMSATGVLYADGAGIRGLPAADNLGTHVMTQNLRTGSYWLSNDGSAAGVSVNSLGNVGVGINPATVRFEVNDADANTNTSGMKFSNFACTGTQKLTVDVSGNLVCSADQTGSGTGNLVDNLSDTLGAGNNAGTVGMVNLGDMALGLGTAGTRLDVQAGAGGYAQFWRDSGGTIVASMSATGVLYASGTGIRGLPAADNLGTHVMAQNLQTGAYWLSSDGGNAGISVNAAGNVGVGVNPPSARLEVNDADADVNTSGVKFTNFACTGTQKLTVDVSGNLVCAVDQAGSGTGNIVDNLTDTLASGNNAGGAGMVNLGSVALGLGSAGTRLDVQANAGGYSQFWRNSGGTVVASMSATGVLYADASGLRNIVGGGTDNLGNHTMTQNLRTGSFWLSSDGSAGGISVNSSGNVGVGVNPPTARFEVNDADANSATSGMKFSNFACTGTQKLTVDVSGNLVCSADQTGSGTGNLIDSLFDTLGAGNNAGGAGMVNVGDVAIGLGSAGTSLDVKANAGGYAQFWRNAGGTVVASMSATGVLYADASGLRGIVAGGGSDNLGDHTMTQNLRAGSFWLSSDGGNAGVSINAAGNVGVGINPPTARFEVNDADANSATSGMKFSNFSCTGTQKLTVDVSGNLVCSADQTGSGTGNLVDSLFDTLGAGNNAGTSGMVNLGYVAIGQASAGTSLDVQANGGGYSQFWRNSGGTVVASMSATGVLYADAAGIRGLPSGDSLGDHTATQNIRLASYYLSGDGGNEGISVTGSGNVGVGVNPATARLEVNDADANSITSGVKFTNFACTGTQKLTVDVSGNLVCSADQTGSGTGNLIDNLTDTLSAGNNAGAAGMVNLGDVAIGLGSAGTSLDVQANGGGYSQFWRNAGGTVVASMSATGVLYADASGLRGIATGSDNLGNHIMTQNLQAGSHWLSSDGSAAGISINASGNVGVGVNPPTARFEVNDADANTNTSGMKFSNFACTGTQKLTVDVSGNLVCSTDQTGSGTGNLVDSLFDTLGAGNNAGASGMVNVGYVAIGLGSAGTSLDVQANGGGYSQFWRNAGGTVVASMSATGVLYGDASGLRNLPAGGSDNLGNHTLTQNLRAGSFWLSSDGSAAGIAINASGNVGVGVNPPTARLEVNDADANSATSGMKFTNFACTGTQKLTVDVSGNLVCSADQTGSGTGNLVDSLFDTLGAGNNAGASGMVNVGYVAIGLGSAGTSLDVQANGGGYSQFWRNAGGTVVASMSATGVLYADAAGIRGLPSGDNLGDHTAAQNIRLGSYFLSGDGGNEGVSVNSAGNVGIGANPATARLEVNDGDADANTSGVKFTNFACSGSQKLTVDVSGNLICSTDQTGSGSGNLVDNLTDTLGAGNNAGGAGMVNLGGVAIGLGSAGTSLDVQAAGGYSQFWRNASGTIVASMSATGVLYGDASGLRNLATGTDNLGNHTLTQNLTVGSNWISGDGGASGISVNASGNVGIGVNPAATRFEVNDGDGNSVTSGVKFTNFTCTAAQKLTVDVSGNLVCSVDQTGSGTGNLIDNLSDTLSAGSNAGGAGMVNLGDVAIGIGAAVASLDVQANISGYSQIWRDTFGTVVASMSVSGELFMDASGIRNLPSGNVVDNLAATLTAGASAGNRYIINLSSAALGRNDAEAILDVQAAGIGTYTQIWRDSGGVIQSSMTSGGVLFADASGLRNMPIVGDGLGGHMATQILNMNDFMLVNASTITAAPGEPGIAFSTTLYVGGSVLASGGAMFNNGPLLVGTPLPLAAVHISSVAGFAGDMVAISTGLSTPFIRMTGNGDVYASKFHGDGSALTGVGGIATTDMDMSGFGIVSVSSIASTGHMGLGNNGSVVSSPVLMLMEVYEEANISAYNVGAAGIAMINPTTNRTGSEFVLGGNFRGGTWWSTTNDFPWEMGLRTAAYTMTSGTVNRAMGLYVQNEQTQGTVTNNYGVYIDRPSSTGTIISNTGLYIADQKTGIIPGSGGYNIYSAGLNSQNRFEGEVEVVTGLRLSTSASKPSCSSGKRGLFWHTPGGAGVKDTVEVCAKDAADAYSWRPIY